MSYLRFTPDEYLTLSSLSLELSDKNVPSFQRLMVAALAAINPQLAKRVGSFGREKIGLLYFHFRSQPPVRREHNLSAAELQTLELVCRAAPFPVRFVKVFKELIVGMLEEREPELARKVARLSSNQFDRLYSQAVCRKIDD